MATIKHGAASDGDGWHDETVREIEREIYILRARLGGLTPRLTLEAVLQGEGIATYQPENGETVRLGSKVTLHPVNNPDNQYQITIVGRLDFLLHPESNPTWATIFSPYGLALSGKSKGEPATVLTSEGELTLIIDEVSPATELTVQKR
jgi:transcription elongation GreA/GreB family factor